MNQLCNDKKDNWLDQLSENTILKRYLLQIEEEILYDDSYKLYRDNITNTLNEEGDGPFLTILIRTQGKREDGLREALLCVLAQTYTNYEIILIGHKIDEKNKIIVKNILDEQQEEYRKKIRYYELDEGTRTTPLNYGFSLARGKYIVVYDDDDIVFDDWVENFYNASLENEGMILHAYAFLQKWDTISNMGYRAISEPQPRYCTDYDLFWQLINNRCPLMTLAFPTSMFQKLGICFDEKLNIMEDWEYFMRLSPLCGVADIRTPVSIYRFWDNIETSATLYNQGEWDAKYKEIKKDIVKNGILVPNQYSVEMMQMLEKRYLINNQEENFKEKARLYYSYGEAFNDEMLVTTTSDCDFPKFNYWFSIKMKSRRIKAMRFDLSDDGLFYLEKIYIQLYFSNGKIVDIPFEKCAHNGWDFFGKILFINAYPEIVWEVKEDAYLECVHVSGQLSRKSRLSSIKYRILNVIFSRKYLKLNRKFHKKGLF